MRKRARTFWKLFPAHFVIIAVCVCAIVFYTTGTITRLCKERELADLETQAFLVQKLVQGKLSREYSRDLNTILKQIGPEISSRITVLLPSGSVLADSQEDPDRIGDYSVRPEIKDALTGKRTSSTRLSITSSLETTYLATPVFEDGRIVGVVRVSAPVEATGSIPRPLYVEILLGTAIIFFLAAALSMYVSRRIHRSVLELREGAAQFSGGKLNYRLDVPNDEDFGSLAEDLNNMAAQLHGLVTSITQQRNELEAVLHGMVEAVLLIDTNERVLRTNEAAERLFQLDRDRVKNRTVHEVIRNTELHRFVSKTLAGKGPFEGDIIILGSPDKFLQAHGVGLLDTHGNSIGAVVVLNDVTRLKTLENIRRDFVANVSHELKTPITSMKGFLETLREGAMNDPENAGRFLDIIIKHTDRLNAIIDDLLSLSRIERDVEKGGISTRESLIKPVIEAVVKSCNTKAQPKNIIIECDVDTELVARINPILLEQALVNLVDNAIKYSETGGTVLIEALMDNENIIVRVRDHGCGIPKEHLPRIFERFYRVDKARSRKVGGTGLGLSIVKHIVNAHGGRITVESSLGLGSTFTIHLPNPRAISVHA